MALRLTALALALRLGDKSCSLGESMMEKYRQIIALMLAPGAAQFIAASAETRDGPQWGDSDPSKICCLIQAPDFSNTLNSGWLYLSCAISITVEEPTVGTQGKFSSDWEPVVLTVRVLADGSWTFQGKVEYSVCLIQRTWDYTASDVQAIESAVSGSINEDYIDYAISDEGDVYFWEFTHQTGCTTSPHFSSMEAAKKHFSSYAGVSKICWYLE